MKGKNNSGEKDPGGPVEPGEPEDLEGSGCSRGAGAMSDPRVVLTLRGAS